MSAWHRPTRFTGFNGSARVGVVDQPGASHDAGPQAAGDGDSVHGATAFARQGSGSEASAFRARVALLFLSVAMASCGGGGDGSSAPLPPPPPPALIPAVTSVPEPVGYSEAKLAAFHRLNELRAQAGLGLLAQNTSLDAAAQAHADWEVFNNLYAHDDAVGTPKYSGDIPINRDAAFGYVLGGFNDEVLTASYAPSAAVDLLVQVVYHRQAVLAHELLDIGIGWSDEPIPSAGVPLVMDMGTPGNRPNLIGGQAARLGTGGIIEWPVAGAQGVFCVMGGEFPNPLPGRDMWTIGTPISVEIDYSRHLNVSSFVLTDQFGKSVDVSLLTSQNDPNRLLFSNFAAIIPNAPLMHSAVYRVDFHGDADGEPISRSWTFATGQVDAPPSGY